MYMAHSLDKLIVDMPKGKKPSSSNLTHLNQFANQVIGMVMQLEEGRQCTICRRTNRAAYATTRLSKT